MAQGPDLTQVRALMQQGNFRGALGQLNEQSPTSREVRFLKAACLRYLGQLDSALAELDALRQSHADYARAWQETGHVQRARGQSKAALLAYRQAVTLNPALMASWQALSELEASHGEASAGERAGKQVQRLKGLPRELLTVTSLLHEGKLYKAEQLCRAFLKSHPAHIEGMRLLAALGLQLNVLDDAEYLLETALGLDPRNAFVRYDYVTVLARRQKFAQALEEAATLRRAQPGNPSFETAYANQLMAVGRFDEALTVYEQVLEALPDHPGVQLSRGHALKTKGDREGAIAAYQAARQSRPQLGDAWWSLANLKTYVFDAAELDQMRALEAGSDLAPADRYHLCFALGKALEDGGEYAESWDYYARGNALKAAELRYDPERVSLEMAAQREVCTADFFAEREGWGDPAADPIFVVGLPRAGSTLIEQILASHSMVDGTLELPNVLALVHRLNGRLKRDQAPRYPLVMSDLTAAQAAEFGRAFIDDTQLHRQGAPHFIDKMPNNFRHIGLIALMLPNARFIDARRHPMACCFSGFKQLFAEGQEFSYRLEDIGRYYREYVALMAHWDDVLPGRVLRVDYESVVGDLETQVRRMLDFLGLPFESACLDFHQTKRLVRTASAEQVRQPINTQGVDQWRHYEPWLGPLREALGAHDGE